MADRDREALVDAGRAYFEEVLARTQAKSSNERHARASSSSANASTSGRRLSHREPSRTSVIIDIGTSQAAMRTKRDLEAMEQLVARLGPTVLTALLACTTAAYLLTASQALSHAAAPLLYASLLLLANATAALLLGRFVGYPFTLSETSWASLLASTPGALATSLRLAFLLAAIRAGSLALALSGDALGRAVGAAAADAAVSTQRVPRSRLTQALGAGAVGVVLGVFGGGVGDSAVKGLLVLVMLVASSCAASAWSQIRLAGPAALSGGTLPKKARELLASFLASQGEILSCDTLMYEACMGAPLLMVLGILMGEGEELEHAHVTGASAAALACACFGVATASHVALSDGLDRPRRQVATTTALGQVGATCFSVVVGVAGAAGPAGRVIASVGAVVAVGAGTHALDMGQGLGSQGQGANGVREKVGEVEGSAMAEV